MYKVLIAEDEAWIRKSLKKMIQWDKLGLTLSDEACDGQEAYDMALVCRPHLLITDVRMPGINGLDLAEKLSSTISDLKIIFISGFDEFRYVKRAIDINAMGYVLKPIKEEELNTVLQKAILEINENTEIKELKENVSYVTQKLISDVVDLSSDEYYQRFKKSCRISVLLSH